ncbi:hypothetical protein ALI144C_05950 [Actinosynnema sp. ALI-1.44]|nr:hypothetical protein ALI144C_05950 [Actinosynnema sp. ALI-1.44]
MKPPRAASERRPADPHEVLTVRTTSDQADIVVVAAAGEVDLLTTPLLEQALDTALRPGSPPVVVDLSRVTFFAAAGIRALLVATAAGPRRRLPIVASPDVLRLLRIAGVDKQLTVRDTLADAMRHLTMSEAERPTYGNDSRR